MILSILIPTTSDRENYFADVMWQLSKQVHQLSQKHKFNYWERVEILKDPRGEEFSIGQKRNDLLFAATGKYVCFIDSDDRISETYLETVLKALESSPDCLSLRGIMTTDDKDPQVFEHSLKYQEWKDNGSSYPEVRYERYPNHLNVILAAFAKQFTFPKTYHGEDKIWSDKIHESGLLRKEVYINEVLYYYQYRTNK